MLYELLEGFAARLEKVEFDPELEAPPEQPYPFTYLVVLENHSEQSVRIQGRKWVVKDKAGYVRIVEGNGLVGQFPCLESGETFSYTSYMTISADSTIHGTFFGQTGDDRHVMARLPSFELIIPA